MDQSFQVKFRGKVSASVWLPSNCLIEEGGRRRFDALGAARLVAGGGREGETVGE